VAICVFYTFLGGIKAVIWTDVFQITTTFAVFACIAIYGTIHVGGLEVVYARNLAGERFTAPSLSFDPTIRHTLPSLMIGGTFFWMATNCGNQNMIQRYLSLPDLRSTRIALWIYVVGVVVFIGLSCYLGLLIYAYYDDCDPFVTGVRLKVDLGDKDFLLISRS
jgi:solute carrier family 5 (sodium-coupled monocarboxylate transporter), member 8/12